MSKAKPNAGWILGIFLLFVHTDVQADSTKEAKHVFSEAQASFSLGLNQQGEQKRLTMFKAAGQFQVLIQKFGIENGNLYYNIGNAYYEAGDIGQAILNYRRAERLIPGSVDLKTNLDQARRDLSLPQAKEAWWADIGRNFFFWHFLLDYSTRRNVFLGAFVLVWGILVWMIFKRHLFLRTAFIATLLLILSFGGSYLLSSYQLYFVQSGVVTAKKATARKGPGQSYERFFQQALPSGTEFDVVERLGEWWRVRLPGGEDVWLEKANVEPI